MRAPEIVHTTAAHKGPSSCRPPNMRSPLQWLPSGGRSLEAVSSAHICYRAAPVETGSLCSRHADRDVFACSRQSLYRVRADYAMFGCQHSGAIDLINVVTSTDRTDYRRYPLSKSASSHCIDLLRFKLYLFQTEICPRLQLVQRCFVYLIYTIVNICSRTGT